MSPELLEFLASIAAGILLLFLWDIFHGMRCAFFKGTVSNAVLDIAWWIFAAVLIIRTTAETNNMQLRMFVAIGLLGGGFLYHITLSKLFRKLFCVIFGTILKIIKFIFKILLTPAHFLYKILLGLFKKTSFIRSAKGGRQ